MNLKERLRTIPNWPKKGVLFWDITTLLKDKEAMGYIIEQFYNKYKDKGITKIVGIESRGFIFGSILAYKLGISFIPVRKQGKLPAETTKVEYKLEYGTDTLEIHNDAIEEGDKVLIVDDLIATGGTAKATAELVEKLKGKVEGFAFVIDLPELKGKEKLKDYDVFNLVECEESC